MRRSSVLVAVIAAMAIGACGGDSDPDAAEAQLGTDSTPAAEQEVPATTLPQASTTEPSRPAAAGIAALTSGRGDDGSLEVGIWFAADPFAQGEVRLVVGTDSDDSFPGVGDPEPHLDGWAVFEDDEMTLVDSGITVAADSTGDLNEWLSWTGRGSPVWFYFIETVPVRAGTVWAIIEIDGERDVAAVAGAPFGEGCSVHGSGLDLGPLGGEIPQSGGSCRYPAG